MSEKILFVDDDKNILSSLKRQFHTKYQVHISEDPTKALEIVNNSGPFAVVIADMRMPELDGVQFLSRVKEIAPDTVRVILTGQADMESAIASVNEGHIFRFLIKPCPPEEMNKVLEDCVRQYTLIKSERELLQGTLRGTINVLSEILSLTNPEAFSRASRIKRLTMKMAQYFQVKGLWEYDLAAMLSQIGCVTLPQQTMQKLYHGEKLDEEERQLFDVHPSVAQNLLQHIPRLEEVSEMILYQEKNFDGSGFPNDQVNGVDIPLGARILKVALDYDLYEARELEKAYIFPEMKDKQGVYDPQVLLALEHVLGKEAHYRIKYLPINKLNLWMIFGQEVRTKNDILLLAKGQEVNETILLRLQNFYKNYGIKEPIKMYVPP